MSSESVASCGSRISSRAGMPRRAAVMSWAGACRWWASRTGLSWLSWNAYTANVFADRKYPSMTSSVRGLMTSGLGPGYFSRANGRYTAGYPDTWARSRCLARRSSRCLARHAGEFPGWAATGVPLPRLGGCGAALGQRHEPDRAVVDVELADRAPPHGDAPVLAAGSAELRQDQPDHHGVRDRGHRLPGVP